VFFHIKLNVNGSKGTPSPTQQKAKIKNMECILKCMHEKHEAVHAHNTQN